MSEENKNLSNLYRLRGEFKKELERRGKKIPQENPNKDKKRTVYKPDIETKHISLPINNCDSWLSLVFNDISVSDNELATFLEGKLYGKKDSDYNNQLGLMHLLRNNYDKAQAFFELKNDEVSKFNLGVLKIFRNDKNFLEYAKSFTNISSKSAYPFLLLSLIFLKENRFHNSYLMLKKANEVFDHAFFHIITNIYERNFSQASSYISKAFLQGKAKKTIYYLNYFLGLFTDDFDKSESAVKNFANYEIACSNCIVNYANKKPYTEKKYCPFSFKLANYLIQENKYNVDNIELNIIDTFNKNNKNKFNEYYTELIYMFGEDINVSFFPKDNSNKVLGMKNFIFKDFDAHYKYKLKGPDYFDYLSKTLSLFNEKTNKEFDFLINIPFYEVLRMAFGWKTCERIYNN